MYIPLLLDCTISTGTPGIYSANRFLLHLITTKRKAQKSDIIQLI